MKSRRRLFDDLIEGVGAMRESRMGQITLRTHEIEVLPPLAISGKRIRETRRRLGLSRAVFARRLRVSTRTLENWEQDRSEPNAQAAALILMVDVYPDTLDRLAVLGRPQLRTSPPTTAPVRPPD